MHQLHFLPFMAAMLTAVPAQAARSTPLEAEAVVQFWEKAGPTRWFAKDPDFDRLFRERFEQDYVLAAGGALSEWEQTPTGALALILLLDQYPRNSFRGTSKMYATDDAARAAADRAIAAGHDRQIGPALRRFVYLPFGHSESIADQERSVALAKTHWAGRRGTCQAPSRHYPPLRPIPAPQPDPRSSNAAGGAKVSRRRRLQGLMGTP